MKEVDKEDKIFFKDITTFKIGGPISFFREVKNEIELKKVLGEFIKRGISFFVLGGGSNILAPDEEFRKAVLRILGREINIKGESVEVFSGTPLLSLVNFYNDNNFSGLEWAIGIPGTVGGAVRGNAGAFGRSIGDLVKSVKLLRIKNGRMDELEFRKEECNFSYRESIFRKEKEFIIEKVVLSFERKEKEKIEEKMKEFFSYRKEHQPLTFPSAGSVFKNFQGEIKNKKLLNKFPQLDDFNKKKIIPAGFLIEKSGLKGLKKGRVMISRKHANFIINLGDGNAKDVLYLVKLIKDKVKENFDIDLEEEIEILRDFS